MKSGKESLLALILVHYLPSLLRFHKSASGTPETEVGDGRCLAGFPKWRPGPIQTAFASKTDNQKKVLLNLEPSQKRGKGDVSSLWPVKH